MIFTAAGTAPEPGPEYLRETRYMDFGAAPPIIDALTRFLSAAGFTVVATALDELPEQQRTAFRLFDIEDYPAQEIATLMGISAGAVRAHVFHARRALRERLGPLLGSGADQ